MKRTILQTSKPTLICLCISYTLLKSLSILTFSNISLTLFLIKIFGACAFAHCTIYDQSSLDSYTRQVLLMFRVDYVFFSAVLMQFLRKSVVVVMWCNVVLTPGRVFISAVLIQLPINVLCL